jgi:hypothetical protein
LVEPAVYMVLDVFFLVFLRRPYEGLLDEETLSYKGFVCDPASRDASRICGEFGYYYDALASGAAAGTGVVNGSVVLSSATGRRLSEALTEPLIGKIDTQEAEGALTALVTMFVVVGAQLADVSMHVVYTIASEALTLILDAAYTLINAGLDIMMMLIRSGLLEKLLYLAIDLFVIYFIEIQLPLMFMQLDGLLCIVNMLFGQNTWDAQLECARRSHPVQPACPARARAAGASRTSALQTATSSPTSSSSRPSRSPGSTSTTSSAPRSTARPAVHSSATFSCLPAAAGCPRTSPRCKRMAVPRATAARRAARPSTSASACPADLRARGRQIPELRLVAFLIMSIVGCTNPSYANQYFGTVERDCAVNGSFYTALCGPRGDARFISDEEWRSTYTAHREYDAEHVQNFASFAAQRAIELGGAAGSQDGFALDQIAQAWFQRDETLPEQDQAADFYRRVCEAMRDRRPQDGGPDHQIFQDGSVLRMTSEHLYSVCKNEASYMCHSPIGKGVQNFVYEFSLCYRDLPDCLKARETCLGTCGGDGEEMRQDFATTMSKNELSVDFLQEDFARVQANCTMKSVNLFVPLFGGGENFRAFSSRLRVRGGFTGE